MQRLVSSETPSSQALSASRTAMVRLAKPVCAENCPPGPAAKAFSVLAVAYSSSALSCASFNSKTGGSKAAAWPQLRASRADEKTVLRNDKKMFMVTGASFVGGPDHRAFPRRIKLIQKSGGRGTISECSLVKNQAYWTYQ